jgi:oligosaccharyltransferase complex subunit alpha (ribophorin I)
MYDKIINRSRALVPRIISYTTPTNVDAFTTDNVVASSGAVVTYGPFNHIPASADKGFFGTHQQPVTVRYYHEQPVLEVSSYKRTVEISHWGSNINTEDNIVLKNAGPKYILFFISSV